MTDVSLLRDYIAESGLRLDFIAEKMGLTYQGLKNKLDGKREFKTREVAVLSELLHLTSAQRDRIFFAIGVDCESTRESA